MDLAQIPIQLIIGVVSSLIAAGAVWYFRRQLRESFSSLDMSTGAILGWLLVFILLAVQIVFALTGTEMPSTLTVAFMFTLGVMLTTTVVQLRR